MAILDLIEIDDHIIIDQPFQPIFQSHYFQCYRNIAFLLHHFYIEHINRSHFRNMIQPFLVVPVRYLDITVYLYIHIGYYLSQNRALISVNCADEIAVQSSENRPFIFQHETIAFRLTVRQVVHEVLYLFSQIVLQKLLLLADRS